MSGNYKRSGAKLQIEIGYRAAKSELAFKSPRLWRWDNRLKLLLIASLALAFLFSLLGSLSPWVP